MTDASSNFQQLLNIVLYGDKSKAKIRKEFERLELVDRVNLLKYTNTASLEEFIKYLFSHAEDLSR